MKKTLIVASIVLAAFMLLSASAFGAEIKLLASNAVKEALDDLLPQFEKASGHTVKTEWGGTPDITKRIAGGEVVDIIIIPASGIDTLIKQGRLATGGRTDFVKSFIGVATRPGVPKPDISSGEALKATLLAAKSIIISGGPSGNYLIGLFKRMGITDALYPKMKRLAPGMWVGEALANGEGDIGFTQVSEFLPIKGIVYIGPLPADVQSVTVFSLGLHSNAPSRDGALSLIKFVTTFDAAVAIRKWGMEPAF